MIFGALFIVQIIALLDMAFSPSMKDRFQACMLLSSAGDSLGYHNGIWEFNYNGEDIHRQVHAMGGVENIQIALPHFMASDDTVMHIATAKALLDVGTKKMTTKLWSSLCYRYVQCWDLMEGRGAGVQCGKAMAALKKRGQVPYSTSGGGCGASMRTMCIGLLLWKEDEIDQLISISIESSRNTHNHPTGFLGGVVSALFVSYALRNVPLVQWGYKFLHEVYPKCLEYIKHVRPELWHDYDNASLSYFADNWAILLNLRDINRPDAKNPTFPHGFKSDVSQRDAFYAKKFSFSGWAGSSGHDSVIIAYDAMLGTGNNWSDFCYWSALHGGDNDTTGAIGGAWFGALYGMGDVPENHTKHLEFKEMLTTIASQLFELSKI